MKNYHVPIPFCLKNNKSLVLCAIFDDNGDGFLQKNEVLGFFQNIGRAIWRVVNLKTEFNQFNSY
jgi:hypothetical protein